MLCTPCTCTGEYSKAKRAEDTPQIAMLNYVGLMEALEAMEWDDASYDSYDDDTIQSLLEALRHWRLNMCDDGCFDDNTTVCFCDSDTTQFLYELLWDWRNNMWDDATQCASYDSYDSDTTQIFDENDLLVVIPPAAVGCRRAGSWPTKLPCGHEFVSIK